MPSNSPSNSLSPSQSDAPLSSILPIEDVCKTGSSCSFEGSVENQILVTINKTDFSNVQNGDDGGAIRLHNAGIMASNISFKSCQSKSGGGGAIYVNNDNAKINNVVRFENVFLSNCRASYGGAVYLYSLSEDQPVEVLKCHFTNNQADSSSGHSSHLSGGSAVFLAARRSLIVECDFLRNIGENQLKIFNHFTDSSPSSSLTLSSADLLDSERKNRPTSVVKYCRFDIDRHSKSSVFYLAGNKGTLCVLRNSVFVGDLNAGSYHIDGDVIADKTLKLAVEFCKFSTDYDRSFNFAKSKNYVAALAKKQVFNYNEADEVDERYIFEVAIVAFVVVVLIVTIVLCQKRSEIANLEELL